MLELQNVSFSFNDSFTLEDISFNAERGMHVSVMGASGCGKSTLLKLVYGLLDVHSGKIMFESKEVQGPRQNLIPGHAAMKYLSQDFGLMPYTTVSENIGQYLSNFNLPKKRKKINELLEVMELTDSADKKPVELSGGQQQRVGLAKTLAANPEVLLLDEPFSQIDRFTTKRLQRNIYTYCQREAITCIVATHDASDVLPFSDLCIILKEGRIAAQGNPQHLYKNADEIYTAALFDEVNSIPGKYFGLPDDRRLLAYPHQLFQTAWSPFRVTVTNSFFMGSHFLIEARYNEGTVLYKSSKAIINGLTVFLELRKD